MTLLLLSVLMGYAVRNGVRRLILIRSAQSQPPLFYADLVTLSLSGIMVLGWYLIGSEADHSVKLVQVLAGGIIGWIASYSIFSGTLSLAYIAVAGFLFIVGVGPAYWKNVLNTLNITEIGGVKRSVEVDELGALRPLFVDLTALPDNSNPNAPSHEFDQIARLTLSAKWDFAYMDSLTELNAQLESDNESIFKVLNATLAPIALCGQHVDRMLNHDSRVPGIIRPIAANFSEMLNDRSAAEDLVPRFVISLNDSMERLRELFMQEPQKYCQMEDKLDSEDWKTFVAHAERYPYGTIALAYLLVRIGNEEMAVNVLQNWINNFRNKLLKTSPLGVTQVSLVRAYHVLERIAGVKNAVELAEIRLAYIASLEELLSVAKLRGLVVHTANCGKYSEDEATSFLILAQMSEKNEFAYWIGTNEGILYRNEAVIYSEEVGKYPVGECLGNVLREGGQYEMTAAFRDTFAYVKLKFGIHDINMCIISKKEFEQLTRDAITAWKKVLENLDETEGLSREPWIRRITEHRLAMAKNVVGQGKECRN